MGTKNSPGKFDYYAKAEPDEPMFVLLARDKLAPNLVREWARRESAQYGQPEKINEALACARRMEWWRTQKRLARGLDADTDTNRY